MSLALFGFTGSAMFVPPVNDGQNAGNRREV
jgi:hypothetical protein